jgi:hypothetical protein
MTILVMELLSRSLRRSPSTNANLERSEYARRDRDMLWYLFRGAIWQDWTRYGIHVSLLHYFANKNKTLVIDQNSDHSQPLHHMYLVLDS